MDEWDDVDEAEPDQQINTEGNEKTNNEHKDVGDEEEEDWSDVLNIEVLENYCSNLMLQMEEFRQQGVMCDAFIVVDDAELPCHKTILSSVCPFFKRIFSQLKDPNENRITLRNLNKEIMNEILHFMYTGEATIHDGNVRQLVATANFLQLKGLKEMGVTYLHNKLDASNAVDILLIADKHKCDGLVVSSEKLIKDSFVVVSRSEGFKKLTFEMLYQLVRSEHIRVVKEEEVYEAVMTWLKSDFGSSDGKLNQMPDLFQEIRFALMSPNYLREILEKEDFVRQDQACLDMVSEAEKYASSRNPLSEPATGTRLLQPRKFMGVVTGLVCPGGWQGDQPSNKVYAYVSKHSKWYPLSPLPCPRYAHSVIAFDGFVYVLGGRDESSRLLSTAVRFDTIANTWQLVRSLPYRGCALGSCVFQGDMFVVGGVIAKGSTDSVLRYSQRHNSWQRVASLTHSRGGAAVVSCDKLLYAIGGVTKTLGSESTKWEFLDTVEVFDRESNKWRSAGCAPSKRAYASAAYLNKKIYVVGGQIQLISVHAYKTIDIYDTYTREWLSSACNNLVPRSLCGIAVSESDFFVVGGINKEGESMRNVDTYNVNTCKWRKSTSLPVSLGGIQCCAMKLRLALLQELKAD